MFDPKTTAVRSARPKSSSEIAQRETLAFPRAREEAGSRNLKPGQVPVRKGIAEFGASQRVFDGEASPRQGEVESRDRAFVGPKPLRLAADHRG